MSGSIAVLNCSTTIDNPRYNKSNRCPFAAPVKLLHKLSWIHNSTRPRRWSFNFLAFSLPLSGLNLVVCDIVSSGLKSQGKGLGRVRQRVTQRETSPTLRLAIQFKRPTHSLISLTSLEAVARTNLASFHLAILSRDRFARRKTSAMDGSNNSDDRQAKIETFY